jgi:hypothetical protein
VLNLPRCANIMVGQAREKFPTPSPEQHRYRMEDDRAQVDLGVAVDVEERLEEAAVQRQPKKRFVGRRVADAASSSGTNGNQEHIGAIEGKIISLCTLYCISTNASKYQNQDGCLGP